MEGRKETVSDKLDVRGKTLNHIIQWYCDDELIVNRRYQRKLVWTLEEKKLFIDSILYKYPTPSIILAEYEIKDKNGEEKDQYEIIDGLQRLNAIISFARGEFSVKWEGVECYCNASVFPKLQLMVLRGELTQKQPMLPLDLCMELSEFELPVVLTKQKHNRDERIESIFSRINSAGRKLSKHDLRQANTVGAFPDLVRRVSASIRGDYTYFDEICLCDMPQISISSPGLDYGVEFKETFWIKHGILTLNNFRQSRDEEIIASVLAMSLLGWNFKPNSDKLDKLYTEGTGECSEITALVDRYGRDEIEDIARGIQGWIENIFEAVGSTFSEWLYVDKKSSAKDIGYIVLFCVLYRLKNESYEITDFKSVADALKKNASVTFEALSADSNYNKRVTIMELLYGCLKSIFTKKLERQRTDDDMLLERLLSLSPIESQMIEFKIGITSFDSGEVNHKEIERICKTLVAMANTQHDKQEVGYIIIGVADNEDASSRWEAVYQEKALVYGKQRVVGVDKEAVRCFGSVDSYVLRLSEMLEGVGMRKSLEKYVLSNMRSIDFKGRTLVLLPSKNQTEASYYKDEYYERHGSRTVRVGESSSLNSTVDELNELVKELYS